MQDFLFFRKMLTRTFIQYIYWVWLALAWLGALVVGIAMMFQGGIFILIGPIAFVLIGAIYSVVVRIMCELMIVGFEIHAELVAVRNVIAPAIGGQGFPVTPIPPAVQPPM